MLIELSNEILLDSAANNFCEFQGVEQRHLSPLNTVNSTHVSCATPLLRAGDYAMLVGSFAGQLSVFVEVGPVLAPPPLNGDTIVIASALSRELAVPFSNLVRPGVLCHFGEKYGSTAGLLVATQFSSHYSLLQCAIPLGAQMSQFPLPLTREQIVVAPTLAARPSLAFGFAPSASYFLPHLPTYLAHSIELDMTPVTQQLSPLFDLTCNFSIASTHPLTSPLLSGDKCAFAPPLSLDRDFYGECVPVTLSVGGIHVQNQFTYCSDAFVYIKRVEPLILTATTSGDGVVVAGSLQQQLRLTLNRADADIVTCKVGGVVVGQYWPDGSICTFDAYGLPTDVPLDVEVTLGDDVWHSVSPSARLPVIISILPEFSAGSVLYSSYHPNDVLVSRSSEDSLVADPQVKFIFDSSLTVLHMERATIKTEPQQDSISAVMALFFTDEIKDGKAEYIQLQDIQIPYLPRLSHETKVSDSSDLMFN